MYIRKHTLEPKTALRIGLAAMAVFFTLQLLVRLFEPDSAVLHHAINFVMGFSVSIGIIFNVFGAVRSSSWYKNSH